MLVFSQLEIKKPIFASQPDQLQRIVNRNRKTWQAPAMAVEETTILHGACHFIQHQLDLGQSRERATVYKVKKNLAPPRRVELLYPCGYAQPSDS